MFTYFKLLNKFIVCFYLVTMTCLLNESGLEVNVCWQSSCFFSFLSGSQKFRLLNWISNRFTVWMNTCFLNWLIFFDDRRNTRLLAKNFNCSINLQTGLSFMKQDIHISFSIYRILNTYYSIYNTYPFYSRCYMRTYVFRNIKHRIFYNMYNTCITYYTYNKAFSTNESYKAQSHDNEKHSKCGIFPNPVSIKT